MVVAAVRSGASFGQVSSEMDIGYNLVRAIAARNGVASSATGMERRYDGSLTDRAIAAMASGLSKTAAARRVGMSPQALGVMIKRRAARMEGR